MLTVFKCMRNNCKRKERDLCSIPWWLGLVGLAGSKRDTAWTLGKKIQLLK